MNSKLVELLLKELVSKSDHKTLLSLATGDLSLEETANAHKSVIIKRLEETRASLKAKLAELETLEEEINGPI